MKKIITLLSLALATSFINAGVSLDTLVETPQGPKEIGSLNTGDDVFSFNSNFFQEKQIILTIEETEIDRYIEITTEDNEIIRVSPDQRLFVPQKWVQADLLSLGDVLLRKDRTFIRIKSICLKQESLKLRFITVKDCKNFLISKNGVLIHNGPICGAIGYWATKTLCYGTAVGAVGTLTAATGGVAGAALHTTAAAVTLGASAEVTLVGAAITGAGLGTEAAVTTAAVVTSAGGVAEAFIAVETLSNFVSAGLTFAWFLP